jgi:uncharacterized protein
MWQGDIMRAGKLKPRNVALMGLLFLSLPLMVFLANLTYQRSRLRQLTLAAGASTGESYLIGSALRAIVERHYPRIKISLLETGGTVENLKLIEDHRADLAVAQADVTAGPSARVIAVLYDDTFQLLAHQDSNLDGFAGLRGKRVALSRSGGQFQSFLRVADHFGLHESDFRFVGLSDDLADQAFTAGEADATFRVRAVGNPAIQRLVQTGKVRLLRIDQAQAMKINNPAFEPSVIPAGAYLGNPSVPAGDLPSIAVHRLMMADSNVDDETIRAITQVLLERRHELAQEIPNKAAVVRLLLAQVRRPEVQAGLGPAAHPGAVKFYEKDKPSFVLAHADYLGLMLTVLSW